MCIGSGINQLFMHSQVLGALRLLAGNVNRPGLVYDLLGFSTLGLAWLVDFKPGSSGQFHVMYHVLSCLSPRRSVHFKYKSDAAYRSAVKL